MLDLPAGLPFANLSNPNYRFSAPMAPHLYDHEMYFSLFAPRVHKNASLAEEACRQHYDDWIANVGKLNGAGCLNPYCGAIAGVFAPECLPERLGIISYVIEYAFFHDDIVDTAPDPAMIHEENNNMLLSFDPTSPSQSNQLIGSGKKQLQAKIAFKLLTADNELGAEVLEDWEALAKAGKEIREWNCENLDEFIELRVVDGGAPFVFTILRFGLDLHLTQAEKAATAPMAQCMNRVIALQNDYFSWDKEYAAWLADDKAHSLINAVYIVMKQEGLDVGAAKEVVKAKFMDTEREYCRLRNRYLEEEKWKVTANVRKWLEGLELGVAGFQIWSMTCPRYQVDVPSPYLELAERKEKIDWVEKLKMMKRMPGQVSEAL